MNTLGREAMWRPGKLWNVFDMLRFNASAFYEAVSIMRRAQGISESEEPRQELSKSERLNAPGVMKQLETACDELGARVTKLAVSSLIQRLRKRSVPIPTKTSHSTCLRLTTPCSGSCLLYACMY